MIWLSTIKASYSIHLNIFFKNIAHHKRDAILEVFEYLESEPLLAALLSENGTKEIQNFLRNKLHIILSTDLQKRFMQLNLNTTELEYSSIYLTHALFGVCQTWIAHGKKESPQEITDFLMKMLGDTNWYKKEEHSCVPFYLYSASRTRTYDIMINSHALLPTELWRIK